MDEISKTFNVLVDDHFSSSAVSESRFHDFGKIIYDFGCVEERPLKTIDFLEKGALSY